MAEAVLNWRGTGRFEALSAGMSPAAEVNPQTLRALREWRVPGKGHTPRGLAGLGEQPWDFVITLCERAKYFCPTFHGRPFVAHWPMPDLGSIADNNGGTHPAFRAGLLLISRRIDLFVTLPLEKLGRLALEGSVQAIGDAYSSPGADRPGPGVGAAEVPLHWARKPHPVGDILLERGWVRQLLGDRMVQLPAY
jgi:arsenate reductase